MKKLGFLLAIMSLSVITEAQTCHASFSYDIIGATVNLRDTSGYYYGNVYQWNFGDGNTGNGKYVQHTYSLSGTYNICLTIADSASGCYDTFCNSLYVSTSCQASFTHQTNGGLVYFRGASVNYSGNTYLWNFGDGNNASGLNQQHTYSSVGTYNVCLTIIDTSANCSNTYCQSITIIQCQALFNHPYIIGSTVYFSDTGSNYHGNTYLWTFGDGNSGSGRHVQHTYSSSGTYNVCLTIGDSNTICFDTYCDSVTISTDCQASFNYNTSGLTLSCTDASINYSGNYYLWNFGDGQTTYGRNQQHTYIGPGSYHVTLTIIDTTINCMDSFSRNIVIYNNNSITGQVMAGSNRAVNGIVYLIVFNQIDSTLKAIDSILTDTAYYTYHFSRFPNGSYLVKAALTSSSPNYSNYIPTYYGNVLYWNQATYININNFHDTANISLISGTNPGGPGFIGGKTSQGANAVLDPGDPIEKVQILLLDEFDNPISYVYSDAIGSFEFDNIALGTYKIYAEVLGKTTFPATVTIDDDNPSISNVKIIIGKKEVTNYIGEDNFEFIRNVSDIYPNPGKDEVSLDITVIRRTNITITVYSQIGEFLYHNTFELGIGSHIVPVNTQNWATGVYYLEINSTEGDRIFRKYVKY